MGQVTNQQAAAIAKLIDRICYRSGHSYGVPAGVTFRANIVNYPKDHSLSCLNGIVEVSIRVNDNFRQSYWIDKKGTCKLHSSQMVCAVFRTEDFR